MSFVPKSDLERHASFFTDSRGRVSPLTTDTYPERANYLHDDGIHLAQLHFDPQAAKRITSTLNISTCTALLACTLCVCLTPYVQVDGKGYCVCLGH